MAEFSLRLICPPAATLRASKAIRRGDGKAGREGGKPLLAPYSVRLSTLHWTQNRTGDSFQIRRRPCPSADENCHGNLSYRGQIRTGYVIAIDSALLLRELVTTADGRLRDDFELLGHRSNIDVCEPHPHPDTLALVAGRLLRPGPTKRRATSLVCVCLLLAGGILSKPPVTFPHTARICESAASTTPPPRFPDLVWARPDSRPRSRFPSVPPT